MPRSADADDGAEFAFEVAGSDGREMAIGVKYELAEAFDSGTLTVSPLIWLSKVPRDRT